eukprot:ctg_110.g47
MVISRGADQIAVSSKYDSRSDPGVLLVHGEHHPNVARHGGDSKAAGTQVGVHRDARHCGVVHGAGALPAGVR